jgi:site-specific DNA-methyltransferase (adenine-specific)
MNSEVYNIDCMEYMRGMPDNAFALAIADPPYGININESIGRRKGDKHSGRKKAVWDNQAPAVDFFNELFRTSKNVVIWGANHFIESMPRQNASCWLLWDKKFSDGVDFSQFEMAWTSFPGMTKKFDKSPTTGEYKFHPTQKPVELYAWILKMFAKPVGGVIFDPMMGSQSSRIAAYKMGFDYVGCELDKEYFDKGCERFAKECMGEHHHKDGTIVIEQSLFDL